MSGGSGRLILTLLLTKLVQTALLLALASQAPGTQSDCAQPPTRLVRMLHVCDQKHHQQGDAERQLFAAAARGNFRSALPCWSFDNLAPLLVIQLPQFELRGSPDR